MGSTWSIVPVRRQGKAYGPLPRSVAWSYPVTPLATFALSGAFDKWDAINAPNLVSRPGSRHAGHATACRHGHPRAGRSMVVAWSTFGPHAIGAERFLAVSSGLQRYIVRPGRRCDPAEQARGLNPDKTRMAVGRHEG